MLFKYFRKSQLVTIADGTCYQTDLIIRLKQQFPGFFHAHLLQILLGRKSQMPHKQIADVRAGQEKPVRQFFYGQFILKMRVDILLYLCHMPAGCGLLGRLRRPGTMQGQNHIAYGAMESRILLLSARILQIQLQNLSHLIQVRKIPPMSLSHQLLQKHCIAGFLPGKIKINITPGLLRIRIIAHMLIFFCTEKLPCPQADTIEITISFRNIMKGCIREDLIYLFLVFTTIFTVCTPNK